MLTVTYGYKNFPTKTIAFYKTDLAATQTSIIQDALNSVSGRPGGFVKLSAGTFTVVGRGQARDGALRIGSSTVLMGAGMAETIITLATGSAGVAGILRADFDGNNVNGSAVKASNVRIECLTINGNSSGTFGEADGFCFGAHTRSPAHDYTIRLDRVAVLNVTRHGLDAQQGNPNLTITDCVLGRNAGGITMPHEHLNTVAAGARAKGDRQQFTAAATSNAVLFQDTATRTNCQTGIVVQSGDTQSIAIAAEVPISGVNVYAPGTDRQANPRPPARSLEHRRMDTIRRRMPVGKGLDIDDDLFAHVDPPFEGGRAHVRQGNDAVRI